MRFQDYEIQGVNGEYEKQEMLMNRKGDLLQFFVKKFGSENTTAIPTYKPNDKIGLSQIYFEHAKLDEKTQFETRFVYLGDYIAWLEPKD